jgi:predicted ABC-type ATPase
MHKNILMIAGPNGAGKTTMALELIRSCSMLYEFINNLMQHHYLPLADKALVIDNQTIPRSSGGHFSAPLSGHF